MKTGSYIIKHLSGTLVLFLALFISAGRIDYWQGWIYVLIALAMFIVNYTVLRIDRDLLDERSKPGEGSKKWDKLLLLFTSPLTISLYITGGLDSGRYHWSPHFHWSLYITGIILTITGQLLFLIAQKQNKFFSSTVRIQTDRGHTVCETGLYKVVRHPAYSGIMIQTLGFPMFFGSLWSIIFVSLIVLLFLIRTYLEDKTLLNELNGYREYTYKTRYKIIPFVW
jgi:protein-S-isoprenylcysteine O-methyltransferase Ste14